MPLKHFPWIYYMNICHVGPPWGHSGTHGGPKMAQKSTKMAWMAQNHQNGSKWHCMTPNDPKTLPMGILHDYKSCWTTLRPFGYPRGAQNGPKQHRNGLEWLKITRMVQNVPAWPQMALKHFPWLYYMNICHVGPLWGHSGTHGGPKMAQNSTKMA